MNKKNPTPGSRTKTPERPPTTPGVSSNPNHSQIRPSRLGDGDIPPAKHDGSSFKK